jgi:hypothetical protein
VDIEDWSAVARLACSVRRLEEHAQALYSLGRQTGIGETLLEQLVTDVDYEWLMMGASHIKVHPHAAEITADAVADCTQAGKLINGT